MPVRGSAEETEQNRLAPTEMYSDSQEGGIGRVCYVCRARRFERLECFDVCVLLHLSYMLWSGRIARLCVVGVGMLFPTNFFRASVFGKVTKLFILPDYRAKVER
jgi:hypothetical protein